MLLILIVLIVAAYLIGSINFAVIFTKAFNHADVRDFGSGNAGTTNVLRVSGTKAGLLTFICDALKGAVACIVGVLVFNYALSSADVSGIYNPVYVRFLCGIACMIGHCWPIFFGFRGGKAAATSIGIFAVCCPIGIALGLIGFAVTLIISRFVSLGSLVATLIVVASIIVSAFTGYYGADANPFVLTVLAMLGGFIVFYRHKENITRLIKGTENKFKVKKG